MSGLCQIASAVSLEFPGNYRIVSALGGILYSVHFRTLLSSVQYPRGSA